MPLYIADYLADTSRLSTLEHGAYLLLIMDYWRNGGLPDDDRKLARVVRLSLPDWQAVRDDIAELFQPGWRHKRIDAELAKSASKSEKARTSGGTGARAKWGEPNADAATRSERLANARKLATHSSREWQALVSFCGGKCVACGSSERIVKDHIKPIYAGGSDGIENLQPLCLSCNSGKGPDQTDRRPHGWRTSVVRPGMMRDETPCETPSERLANASLSQSQSDKKERSLRSLPEREPDADAKLAADYARLAQAEPPRKPARAKPRSSIADDAQPALADAKAANDAGLTPDDFRVQWRKFRDYHRAKGSLMADWSAAWRTWLGNINEFKRGGNHNGKSPTVHDAAREIHAGVVAGVVAFAPRPGPIDIAAHFKQRDAADGMLSEGRG